jgi:hypothetical protein
MTKCYEKRKFVLESKDKKYTYYNIRNSNSENVQLQWKHDFEKKL